MRGVNLNRFSVTKTLKDDRACKTYIAFDRWLQRPDLIVKVFRKAYFSAEEIKNDRSLAWFASMRLPRLLPVIDAGMTKDGDLYLVREYSGGNPVPYQVGIEELRGLISTVSFLQSSGLVHG